jgi:serine/threonine protein kinase
MSPEQIRGLPLDERADVYSFGCMLHELLSGKLPFTGTSTNDLLMKHLKAAPPPLQAGNRNVTDAFAGLVKKMLAKQAKSRPRNMAEFLNHYKSIPLFKEPPAPLPRN